MKKQLLKIYVLACVVALAGCDKGEKAAAPEATPMAEETTAAAPEATPMAEEATAESQEKPSITRESLVTLEATVTAVNPETREVTLENAAGESITVVAGEEVRNFAQIEVGDKLTIDYMEAVEIQVLGPEGEVGAEGATAAGRAEPGEKPAGAIISETSVVVVIEAINKEAGTVTVKGPSGESKTVKAQNPENLDKVAVGDKVRITYTEALAIEVTEQ